MYKDKDSYYKTRGLRRLLYTDNIQIFTAIIGAIASIIAIVLSISDAYPQIIDFILNIFGMGEANAAATETANSDPKPLINMGIMLSIGIAFFWSLAITFHSSDEDKVKAAGDINKMLLGFLIGSGKSILGV